MDMTANMARKVDMIRKQVQPKFSHTQNGSGNIIPKKADFLVCNCGVSGCGQHDLSAWRDNIITKQAKTLRIPADVIHDQFGIDL